MNTELFRVTSTPVLTPSYAMLIGVPLQKDSYRIADGKYYVSVICDPRLLPVKPSIGQQWRVEGARVIEEVPNGDYLMKRHTYETPKVMDCTLPETGEQLIQFIANEPDFKGIGEAKARALWDRFGATLHSILAIDTPEGRKALGGLLTETSVDALYLGYAKYSNLGACNWMSRHKIPAAVQNRLLRHHDRKTIDAIKKNPYLLAVFGMGFRDVDDLSRTEFVVPFDDERRLVCAVEMALKKEVDKGHTYTDQAAIRPHVMKLLESPELTKKALFLGTQKAAFILNPHAGTYHPTAMLLMEKVVSKRLKKLAGATELFDQKAQDSYIKALNENPFALTGKQDNAVVTALNNGVSCITGGAGTGKTTVLRTAIRAFASMGYTIHAVALSGRAAMRLHESIGFETVTIAGFLKRELVIPTEERPLHLLVIDEASMVDIPTMYRLVTHIHPEVRIILSGDPDQLPPIGPGKVLSDCVSCGAIPNTLLDIVKRQEASTGIPEYSKTINDGRVPDSLSVGNVHFHETPAHVIARRCEELYREKPETSRVMGATKKMVAEINRLVQSAVNPSGKRIEFHLNGDRFYRELREGDDVLFTQNNYPLGIQNGSLGKLVSTEAVNGRFGVVALDTGINVEVTQALMESMELGYCITLHKAQGSQFPRVIVALERSRIVDRAWLYTAITRAETEIHMVGAVEDFKEIIKRGSHANRRNSYLKTLMESENAFYSP